MRTHSVLMLASLAVATAACGDAEKKVESKGPAVADVVEFDTAQMRAAGVTLKAVGPLPADTIYLTGTATFDAARVSHVASRIQGRIRRVYADIGTHVRRGDTLAVLDSPELGAAQARWTQARVSRDVARRIAVKHGHTAWFEPRFQAEIVRTIERVAESANRRFATGPEAFSWLAQSR